MISSLSESVTLPSGLVLPNRLVKAALAENMAAKDHQPGPKFEKAYSEWAAGGWGGILTGNIMVDDRFCGSPGDLIIDKNPPLEKWKAYAAAIKSKGVPAIAQINHPGRQAPIMSGGTRSFFDKAIAPSAIPLNIGDNLIAKAARVLVFGTPREMSSEDIQITIRQFADASRFLAEAGFDGIELHGAHGYLIAQFLSPKSNHRNDAYGGSVEKRAKFAVETLQAIRRAVPKGFTVGMKLNSADASQAGSLEETLTQIRLITEVGIDFLEISGGSYENPQMMQTSAVPRKSARSSAREAFFLDFARAVRARFPKLILMVTGGFRSRKGMEAAVEEGACDIIGLGRPSVVNPHWPKEILLNQTVPDQDAQVSLAPAPLPWLLSIIPISVLGAGAETEYYATQIGRIARGLLSFAPGVPHAS
ncbi:FMN binding oxidoreductase [Tothia fuscella]|uniref:FMN binding oxidoreductase n=1 Tax=Tothia fuscella TaxID=1048955 RepID=A0A9P4NZS8_9PEZI|nr:FMN binding oxidoreductase [Tothia fuscella]